MTDQQFGDELARIEPRLLRLANVLTGSGRCEDVVQDTFLLAWRGRAAFRGESSLYTWCCRILTNRVRDLSRRDRLRNCADMEAAKNIRDPRPTIGEILETQEEHRLTLVLRVLPGLPGWARSGVRSYLDNDGKQKSCTEKVRRFRAVRQIRQRLNIQTERKSA